MPIHYVKVADTVPSMVWATFQNGATAVVYQTENISDGNDAIYVLDGKNNTEEGMLHEALHIATTRRIARAIRSSLHDAGARSTDQKFKQSVDFFRGQFRSASELIAYGFSSPGFSGLLKLMAADGKFYTDYRTPEQLAKVNKNAAFQKQKPVAVPEYSMWHRFVDAVRSLFGGQKAYQKAYEQAIATNRAIANNNELASRVEFKTLEEKLHSLMDELLKTQELPLSQTATALPGRVDSLPDALQCLRLLAQRLCQRPQRRTHAAPVAVAPNLSLALYRLRPGRLLPRFPTMNGLGLPCSSFRRPIVCLAHF